MKNFFKTLSEALSYLQIASNNDQKKVNSKLDQGLRK